MSAPKEFKVVHAETVFSAAEKQLLDDSAGLEAASRRDDDGLILQAKPLKKGLWMASCSAFRRFWQVSSALNRFCLVLVVLAMFVGLVLALAFGIRKRENHQQ